MVLEELVGEGGNDRETKQQLDIMLGYSYAKDRLVAG